MKPENKAKVGRKLVVTISKRREIPEQAQLGIGVKSDAGGIGSLASDVSVIMTMRDELLENFGVKVSRNLNLRRNPMVKETSDYVVISSSNAKSLGEVRSPPHQREEGDTADEEGHESRAEYD